MKYLDNFSFLIPLAILGIGGIVVLLLEAFSSMKLVGSSHKNPLSESSDVYLVAPKGSRFYLMPITAIIVLAAIVGWIVLAYSLKVKGEQSIGLMNNMLVVDYVGIFFVIAALSASLIGLIYTPYFMSASRTENGEHYALILFALLGLTILVMSGDLIAAFIGLETLSLSVYILVGSLRRSQASSEASIKYFLMGAFFAAIFIYGVALIYGATGTTELQLLKNTVLFWKKPLFLIGSSLILCSMLFKASVVPLHMWAPDAYEGAPLPVMGFMMSAVKLSVFAFLIRWYLLGMCAMGAFSPDLLHTDFGWGLYWLAVVTILVGNFMALRQTKIKRMLAYSSVAHAGYFLVGLLLPSKLQHQVLAFYLLIYALTSVGMIGAIVGLVDDHSKDSIDLTDLQQAAKHRPLMAVIFSILLLSMAGFPPLLGFMGKFYLLKEAFRSHELLGLVWVVLAGSVIGAAYYLKIIASMFFGDKNHFQDAASLQHLALENSAEHPGQNVPSLIVVVLVIMVILVIACGIYPRFLYEAIPLFTTFQK